MGTIYTGNYKNHSIRIDNAVLTCKLFIDGVEHDVIKGLTVREGAEVLQAVIQEGEEEALVQVVIEMVPIKNGTLIHTLGHRFVVKINGEFFATGFVKRSHQKKYGELLRCSSETARS